MPYRLEIIAHCFVKYHKLRGRYNINTTSISAKFDDLYVIWSITKHNEHIFNIVFVLCFFVVTFIFYPIQVIPIGTSLILQTLMAAHDMEWVIIFTIFFSRLWMIFSNWSFHYNMSPWIWKREINPLHLNCIIR